jgi:RNA polymerase sigma-70 factor (ECF subfamily)
MRMLGKDPIPWKDRSHFLGVTVHMMRQVLIDYARWNNADKRSGKYPHVELTRELLDRSISISDRLDTIIAVHAALARLAEFAPRLAQIAVLRVFWGFTVREVANALDVGRTTINEDWKLARTWLRRELQ